MKFIFKEGFVLASLPIIAFLAAYMFEVGYADAFSISHELIDIDLKVMVISVSAVIFLVLPLIMYCYFLFSFGSKVSRQSRWWALKMIAGLPLLIALYVSGFSSIVVWVLFASVCAYQVISIGIVAIKARKLGWEQALSAAADSQGIKSLEGGRPPSGPANAWDKILAVVMPLFLLLMLLAVVRGTGVVVAHLKDVYPSFTMDNKKYVILASYVDRYVLGGLDGAAYDGNTYVIAKNSDKLVNVRAEHFAHFLPFN